MLALEPRVAGAVWAAVEPQLPTRKPDRHPLGAIGTGCVTGVFFRADIVPAGHRVLLWTGPRSTEPRWSRVG